MMDFIWCIVFAGTGINKKCSTDLGGKGVGGALPEVNLRIPEVIHLSGYSLR